MLYHLMISYVMYHVLALLIIWFLILYNFDNKHTFIVIVIVIDNALEINKYIRDQI